MQNMHNMQNVYATYVKYENIYATNATYAYLCCLNNTMHYFVSLSLSYNVIVFLCTNNNFSKHIRTVSFHNFKSQNLKLSVSNPTSKYVASLSVLSRISNCQGLGRNNKHELLKTDRTITQNAKHALTKTYIL